MGLTSSLQIGRSALTASQVALQVTGNNFANASTPGYSRQLIALAPTQDARYGGYILGRGVGVAGITRQVDQALQARLWSGTSAEQFASTASATLARTGSSSPTRPRKSNLNPCGDSGSRCASWRASATHYVEAYIAALRARGIVPLE